MTRPAGDDAAPREAAQANGIELQVVTLPDAKKGFVLLPRRKIEEQLSARIGRRLLKAGYNATPLVQVTALTPP